MEGEIRPIPGERLTSKLLTRTRRRPRMGFSPEFYARFGMDDPWSFQETGGAEPAGDGFVFLSAAPYYAMLRRLAAARRRREKSTADFLARRAGTRMRAATRTWPGEASLAPSRLARLAVDDLVLPPPIPAAAPVVAEQAAASPTPRPRSTKAPARRLRGADAWLEHTVQAPEATHLPHADAPHAERPAPRVAAPRVAAAAHAGARLARAAAAQGPARRAIEAAAPVDAIRHRRQVARVVETIEALPEIERAQAVRRLVRRIASRSVAEDVVDADVAAPRGARLAARRMAP